MSLEAVGEERVGVLVGEGVVWLLTVGDSWMVRKSAREKMGQQ